MKGIVKVALVLALFLWATTVLVTAREGEDGGSPYPSAAPGERWIDFTLERAGGGTVALSDLAGRTPVLLFFWATWCPHCKEAVPVVNRLQAEVAAAGRLRILALDFMESRERVDAYIRARGVAYPVLFDPDGAVARKYGVIGIPTFVVIGRDGRIVYRDHELRRDLGRYID